MLHAKQRSAATMLAGGFTKRQAARSVNVSAQTLSQWQRSAEFQCQLTHEMALAQASTRNQLAGLRLKALGAIESVLECGNPMAALRAAEFVLEHALASENAGVDPARVQENESALALLAEVKEA